MTGHERSDIEAKSAAMFAAVLLGTTVATYLLALVVFHHFAVADSQGKAPQAIASGTPVFQPPLLQVDPQRDLQQFQAREREALNSYGWVDRAGGVVRIPIDRAMDIVLEKGLPEFGKAKESGAK